MDDHVGLIFRFRFAILPTQPPPWDGKASQNSHHYGKVRVSNQACVNLQKVQSGHLHQGKKKSGYIFFHVYFLVNRQEGFAAKDIFGCTTESVK